MEKINLKTIVIWGAGFAVGIAVIFLAGQVQKSEVDKQIPVVGEENNIGTGTGNARPMGQKGPLPEGKDNIGTGTENYCNGYAPDVCPDGCVVCPPCAECSSIKCRLDSSCAAIGFDKGWYEQTKKNLNKENATSSVPVAGKNVVCKLENCHGLEIKCGANVADVCTMEYEMGDKCLQYVNCGIVAGVCQQIKNVAFDACKACVGKCLSDFKNDPVKSFDCESKCK